MRLSERLLSGMLRKRARYLRELREAVRDPALLEWAEISAELAGRAERGVAYLRRRLVREIGHHRVPESAAVEGRTER